MHKLRGNLNSAAFACTFVLASYSDQAVAVPIHVPGDYPLPSQAIAAAAAGDTVYIALGEFFEPYQVVDLRPGVVVKGSGWNMTPQPGNETRIGALHIRFTPGNEPAVLRDVHMPTRGVTFENPHARVIHCRFGAGYEWQDGAVAAFLNGGTVDSCFVQADFGRWGTPHHCFSIDGGSVLISNNVIDAIRADWLFTVSTVTELEVRDNTFHGYAIDMEIFPGQQGPVTITNNILSGYWGLQCNGTTPLVQYNVFHGLGEVHPTCQPADSTNLFVDPLLCDPHWLGDLDDFALDSDSPCIGAGVGGTTIGALGIACGSTTANEEAKSPVIPLRLEVAPNPITRGGVVMLRGDFHAPILIRAWDASGRLLAERRFASLSEPRIHLDELLFQETRSPGVYFLGVQGADGRNATAKVLVVR